MARSTVIETPLGPLRLEEEDGFITASRWTAEVPGAAPATPLLERATSQIAEYFAGRREVFSLPLRAAGTPFQRRVWQALAAIPYATTRSYGELAAAVGIPRAARAVGTANARNPLSILVPCHRVVRASGEPGGYAGGAEVKRRLLALESTRVGQG